MKQIAAATIAIAMLLFSGCSASQVINTGGDTKCKDFTTQDEKKQNEEISKMLKDKSGAEPNNLEISATRLSALTYCQTVGKEDSRSPRRHTADRGLCPWSATDLPPISASGERPGGLAERRLTWKQRSGSN